MIQYMKELGMELKEIREVLDSEDLRQIESILIRKREQTVRNIFHVTVRMAPQQREQLAKPVEIAGDDKPKPKRTDKKPGRNDPCPCGSGLKYKNCCGRN